MKTKKKKIVKNYKRKVKGLEVAVPIKAEFPVAELTVKKESLWQKIIKKIMK